jgi:mono/diheme cytochrome c family protein
MAAMGAGLSDGDLAAVLTYIRGSWGNKADEVTADDVKGVRAEVGKLPPLTGEKFMGLPE